MFATDNAVEYLDVSLATTPDPLVTMSLVAVVVGGLIVTVGATIFQGASRTFWFGATALFLSMGVIVPMQSAALTNMKTIEEHMAANIKTKYNATLELDKDKGIHANVTDLDKTKKYKLAFEDGASGEYEMFFKETGEPMVVLDTSNAQQARPAV